jgi:adenosine deaminase
VSLSRNSLQYSFLPGAALFEDTYTGRMTEECRHIADSKSIKPEDSCAQLLSSSPKASLQWRLEESFISFEAYIKNQFDELKL